MYGEIKELLPHDEPTPLGNYVSLTNYIDSSLLHEQLDGHSITGILHLVYKTPVDWYYKKHITLDKSTYSSEFVSDRTCVTYYLFEEYSLIPLCNHPPEKLHVCR